MGLFSWMRRRPAEEEPEEEWWERTRRLESRMDAVEMDCERMMGNVKRGLATLGKRARALDERSSGGEDFEPLPTERTPSETGALLRAYRSGRH